MAIERIKGFIAENEDLVFINRQALLNLAIVYVLDDADQTNFSFPGYVSSYMNVYDSPERNNLVKAFTTQVTRNSNVQVLNCSESDMTFESNGTYYYEIGYIISGGYETVLRYGNAEII